MYGAENVPPIRRTRFESSSPDEGTEKLRAVYLEHRPEYAPPGDDRRVALTSTEVDTSAGTLSIERLKQKLYSHAVLPPAHDVLLVVPLHGEVCATVGRETSCGPFLVPDWRPTRHEYNDADVATGQLDLDGVRRIGAAMSGLDPTAVRFTGWTPVSEQWRDVLTDVLGHLGRSFRSSEVADSALLRAEAYRYLASVTLSAFPNTTQDVRHVGRDTGEPATVRRAVEFIDAHARQDIDVTDIAEAARIGVRGLQDAFRRHRGCTPTDYVRRARLEGARRELQAADPTRGDTVAAIAARWGFRHPGRFSVTFREAYGQAPGVALRG